MPGNHTIPAEVGPRFDVGIVSATYGSAGFIVKPGTYRREQQLIKRADVVAALQTALADRDIQFWTRVTQSDWRQGDGQELFGGALSWDTRGIDVHVPNEISAWSSQSGLDSVTTAGIGHGAAIAAAGVGGAAVAAFAWTSGNYRVSSNITNDVPTFSTFTTGGAGLVLDIVSDGANFYFATTGTGVWTTTAAAPGNLTQYDLGANGPYHRLVWDALRRRLFGILAPSAGRALHQVNSGAAPTVIYDFQQGRLDAIEQSAGRIYVGWNTGDAIDNSQGRSMVAYYDGTSTVEAAIGADASQIVGLKSAGVFWVGVIFNDVMASTAVTTAGSEFTLCFMSSGGISGYRNLPDGRLLRNAATFSPFYAMQDWLAIQGVPGPSGGGMTWFGVGPYVWFYNQGQGGTGRAFGRSVITVGGTNYTPHIVGLIAPGDKMVALVLLLDATFANVGGAVWQVSGLTTPNQIADVNDNKLTSGRIDLALPYVDKFWHGFEVVCDPLVAGQQIQMEYSIDDGAIYTLCQSTAAHPNPYSTISGSQPLFLVQRVNPHIRYRIQLVGSGGAVSPRVHAVSAQFAPGNPDLRMWTFTLLCQKNTRLRNNQVDGTEPRDLLDYLFNISERSEPVTFYDNNEALDSVGSRRAHTCWVMQVGQTTVNTSGVYNPLLQEGEVQIMLWETTRSGT